MIKQDMELSEGQYQRIQRTTAETAGNVKIENLTALDALVYICRNGFSWRALPEKFSKWHTIYVRFNRLTKSKR